MSSIFNNRLRQVILLLVIIVLALMLLQHLFYFLPGFLGAITLYILLRQYFFTLTLKKRWNKTLTATLFVTLSLVLIAIPLYYSILLITEKVVAAVSNTDEIMAKAALIEKKVVQLTGMKLLSPANILSYTQKVSRFIPTILNSSAGILSNFAIMFFILYFLLKGGREMEKFLHRFIPLKDENINLLGIETKNMIKANAIGIPVLAIIQGIIAAIGYAIFGIQEYVLWGFFTGIFSMLPVVGTAVIWVPMVVYLYAIDDTKAAIGLLIYAIVLITNIDYVARLTILKKLMDVHPLITIFGVISGVGLFGFWGVIFGPLLVSYFIVLVKIYTNEFSRPPQQ
ncbi:MAG TPA: AI-2E family transporter [Ferruginibacter sp.]|nr:AI-2E family transporter [Ferruginibacter sp.]HMP22352.1 AI-2E family transporter [Ferruginibacter sp.]